VVVADDDPATRLLVRMILEARPSLELLDALDGLEALRLVRAHHPAILLLDLNLPGLDGLAVCRLLRADPDLAGTVVVMVTGWSDDATATAALAAGASEFLRKPFKPVALLGMLDRLLLNSESTPEE
jgi:CheY-like chemotaxis protein